jgi:hypothetical protein
MAHPTAVFALLLSTAQAGPWIKDPGSWYVKASGAQFQANQYIDPLVEADGALDYSSLSVLGYGEVGVAPGVQVHATVPYLWATNQGRETGWTYRQRGMGDGIFGVDVDIPRLEIPASVFVQARLPLYADGDRPPGYPAMGDPQVDVDVQANVGHSHALGEQWVWGIAEGGFRYRTRWTYAGNVAPYDYVNGLPYRVQVGWSPFFRDRGLGWVSADLSGIVNLAASDTTAQWHQVNLGLAVALDTHVFVELGYQNVYRAQASSQGSGWSLGLSHRR